MRNDILICSVSTRTYLLQLHVELQQAVERELAVVVDEYLERLVHEALAHGAHVGRQRRGEHHRLLAVRRHHEDALHHLTHVYVHEANQ